MAIDQFLKIDGIKGESADKKHKEEIEVLSWHWGATQTGTTHSGTGGGAGKANFQDVTITKYLDAASPALLTHVACGIHIPKVLLTVRKAGKDAQEYLKMTMSNAMISSFQTGGSGQDERPTETIGLNFSEYKLEYSPQKDDGTLGAALSAGYNIAGNFKT